jgi:asparagine synthase (glutamine-hydrolysing)
LGHTLLRTTHEAETEKQPLTLDGRIWITADARIDGRRATSTDAELILQAYERWKTDCVNHLIGDFSFAIWDSTLERLFCARDHLGVRQFYYRNSGDCFVFSNTLDCLRRHPKISSELNELAIGDFLVFGQNQDPTTTIFADIKRLPKAHTLTVSREGVRLEEYWRPSVTPVQFKKESDYVEKFREVLNDAVADRLRTQHAGILMSGGLDSGGIAAFAKRINPTLDLKACCVVYDSAMHDEERKYASLAAESLQIPIEFLEGNDVNQQDEANNIGHAPEPFDVDPIYAVSGEMLRRLTSHARVALTGWDGDTFLNETPRHSFSKSLKNGNVGRLLFDLSRFVYFQHGPPPVGIRTQWRRWRNPHWNRPPFPAWLNEDFSERLNLRERWRDLTAERPLAHPLRPYAFRNLYSPYWESLFRRYDAGTTSLPLEVCHPMIDIRMVDYLLALPIIPWLLDKTILRRAMVGFLPEAVRLRPKSPLAGDPGLLLRRTKKFQGIDEFQPAAALSSYVDRKSIPRVTEAVDSNQLWINVRPFSLNQWFVNSQAALEHMNEI